VKPRVPDRRRRSWAPLAAFAAGALGALACSPKPPLGQACDPADASFCTVWEFVCVSDGGSGVCSLPGEFASCDPSFGCAAPYGCHGPFPDVSPPYFCVATCAHTADCPDPDTICGSSIQPPGSFCMPDACGPGSAADGGSANGTAFFAPCDVEDTGDGTCVPYPYVDAGVFGVCQAGGPAADGGACETDRTGAAPLCQVGLGCAQPGAGPGSCAPLCNPVDGGPSCPSDQRCEVEPGFLAGLCR